MDLGDISAMHWRGWAFRFNVSLTRSFHFLLNDHVSNSWQIWTGLAFWESVLAQNSQQKSASLFFQLLILWYFTLGVEFVDVWIVSWRRRTLSSSINGQSPLKGLCNSKYAVRFVTTSPQAELSIINVQIGDFQHFLNTKFSWNITSLIRKC